MNRPTVLQHLAIPENSPIYLLSLESRLWGRDLIFACRATDTHFRLCFFDISESRWRHYLHHESSPSPYLPSELLNFKMGRSAGRSPAQILTEHFGLSLIYGALWLEWDEQKVELT